MSNCELRITNENSPFAVRNSPFGLRFRLGFAKTGDAVAGFALAAFFKECGAFETLEDITFAAKCGCGAETAML
jgi:hypothetical protein